jgi:Arc/MetJ-type ribon-helix-helix transcriptional regulator
MEINLEPKYEEKLNALVQSGRFASASDAVSAALDFLASHDDDGPLDEETLAKIAVGEAQLDRGEYVEYSLEDLDRLPDDIERRAKAKMAERGTVRAR